MVKVKQGSSKKAAAERQARFVDAYLAHQENATRAYMAVFGTKNYNTAAVEAHRLLKHPNVIKMLEKRRAELRAKYALTSDRVMCELARVSYFNPKRLVDVNGKAIPLQRLDDDTAAALSSIEVVETEVTGKGASKMVITRRMKGRPFNKTTALEKSIRILRLYDKPPPPSPDEQPAEGLDDKEVARRLLFVWARGAAALDREDSSKARKPGRKKLILTS